VTKWTQRTFDKKAKERAFADHLALAVETLYPYVVQVSRAVHCGFGALNNT